MFRRFAAVFLVFCLGLSGCRLLPGNDSETPDSLKKNVFGIHGKNDPNFGEQVARDPFPTASTAGVSHLFVDD